MPRGERERQRVLKSAERVVSGRCQRDDGGSGIGVCLMGDWPGAWLIE